MGEFSANRIDRGNSALRVYNAVDSALDTFTQGDVPFTKEDREMFRLLLSMQDALSRYIRSCY